MYTNLGFFRRSYGQSQSPKKFDLKLPKISSGYPSPPFVHSPSGNSSTYSTPKINYKANIFSSNYSGLSSQSYSQKILEPTHSTRLTEKVFLPQTNYFSYSIFEIHAGSYTSQTAGYGTPVGIGFLVTKNIALTANSVIPDQTVASRCYARFVDNLSEVHSLDPQMFFYANKELNLSLIGFKINPDCTRPRLPVEYREEFVLRPGDGLTYLNCGSSGKNVTSVDEEMFIYTAGSFILPGMPLFTVDGRLQGFHHTCTSSYRFNQGTRIDVVVKCVFNVRNIVNSPEVTKMLSSRSHVNESASDSTRHPANTLEPNKILPSRSNKRERESTSDGRFLYWVEWYNRNIYRYDIPQEKWTKLKISNLDSFLSPRPGWSFNWGSRQVYTPASVYIIGGVGHGSSDLKSEVVEFVFESQCLELKKNMIEKREGPGVVYGKGYIFVMGGKHSLNSCERYNVLENEWEVICPMNLGRYDPAAVLMSEISMIYVVGGNPQETVGKSIERYEIYANHWDMVSISLSVPAIRPGIISVSAKKFAVFGGKYSKEILVFDVDENRLNELRYSEVETLPEGLETVYPLVLYKQENRVYIVKSQEGAAPVVLFYNFLNLMRDESRKSFRLPYIGAKSFG